MTDLGISSTPKKDDVASKKDAIGDEELMEMLPESRMESLV